MVACNQVTTKASNTSTTSLSDIYEGYRLELVNLKITEDKGGTLKINGTLINTGKNKVSLPYKGKKNLVINFDDTLAENGLTSLSSDIQQALLRQRQSLEPGQIASNVSVKVKKGKEQTIPSSEEDFITKGESLEIDVCPDLRIDTFFVSKRTKKYAELSFVILNDGNGPAPLFGATKAEEDNVAIRAYASGTAKLSRGDLIIGGAYLKSGLKDKNGILSSKEQYTGKFRVDIRKKTRHMPYIILSVDDYQLLWECDEGNNVKKLLYR